MDPIYYLYLLIAVISISSIYGFSNQNYVQKFIFNEGLIQQQNQYYRMLTSSFLHANYMHLFFNMFVLFQFGTAIVNSSEAGAEFMLLVYFASVLGGSLLSYFLHLNEYNYSALGASGGVTGILMSYVILYPDDKLMLVFLPIPIPGYIFVFLYMCYEVYALIKSNDNIGHDAHIGGAIVGMLITVAHVGKLSSDIMYKVALDALPLLVALVYSIMKINSNRNNRLQ